MPLNEYFSFVLNFKLRDSQILHPTPTPPYPAANLEWDEFFIEKQYLFIV